MSARVESMPAASVTLRTTPRPLQPASLSAVVIAAAPSGVVAVPSTVAPCVPSASAIARPMPRDAPVTIAICPSSIRILPTAGDRFINGCTLLERQHGDFLATLDSSVEPCQHLARAALDNMSHPAGNHCAYGIGPAHRAEELAHQCLANFIRCPMFANVDGVDLRHDGRTHIDALESFAQFLRCRFHQRAVRRHAYRQLEHPLGTFLLTQFPCTTNRIRVTRDDDLAG